MTRQTDERILRGVITFVAVGIIGTILFTVIITYLTYGLEDLTEQNNALRDRVVEQNAQIESLQNKISIQEESK